MNWYMMFLKNCSIQIQKWFLGWSAGANISQNARPNAWEKFWKQSLSWKSFLILVKASSSIVSILFACKYNWSIFCCRLNVWVVMCDDIMLFCNLRSLLLRFNDTPHSARLDMVVLISVALFRSRPSCTVFLADKLLLTIWDRNSRRLLLRPVNFRLWKGERGTRRPRRLLRAKYQPCPR